MSKAIHWTIPFQSVKGVNYEIRIYDEGYTGNAVVLQAGDNPITTQEDASDDFFTPVRPSTGTISVIDPDGTLMEQLLPDNNIARPVRLIKKGATSAQDTIEWQGFLSCEAYQQDYTSVAQELQLSIISVLEAMDSVHMDRSRGQFCSIRRAISNILDEVTTVLNGSFNAYSNIYWSKASSDFMNKYIDTSVLFEEKEVNNEEYTEFLAYSKSCKEILTIIATYIGWTIREVGSNLYFQRNTEEVGMYGMTYSDFIGNSTTPNENSLQTKNISELEWRGSAHNKSVSQGARILGVVANIEQYELSLDLPGYPYGVAQESYIQVRDNTKPKRFFLSAELMEISNKVNLISGTAWVEDNAAEFDNTGNSFSNVYSESWPCTTSNHEYNNEQERTNFTKHIGSYLCKTEKLAQGNLYNKPSNALYLSGICHRYSIYGGLDYTLDDVYSHIFEMHTIKQFFANNGWLRIYASGESFAILDKEYMPSQNVPSIGSSFSLYVTLKYGYMYWNKSTGLWQNTFCAFEMPFTNNEVVTNYNQGMHTQSTNGYFIPIDDENSGCVEIRIHAVIKGGGSTQPVYMNYFEECYLTSLEVTYEQSESLRETDRNANNYSKILDVNFNDEISISTDFATKLNNKPSPSLLIDDEGEDYIELISYIVQGGLTEQRRPERDLLDRLCKYYSKKRIKIELETEHPTQAALPLLTINGYDNRKYLPIAEERDWQQDTSKLTCMESPDGDS